MGTIRAEPTTLDEIRPLRERFVGAARCQIVRYSILPRGLADAWALSYGGATVGYAGVWNRHFPGRVTEFHVESTARERVPELLLTLMRRTGAHEIETQTNLPLAARTLNALGREIRVENFLFRAGESNSLVLPGALVRRRRPDDDAPEGEWVLELDGRGVAAGGFLTHYNAPWADLYYEVVPEARRRGVGSFLVQELRRLCEDAGHRAAARCDPANEASRRALVRGGMKPCGRLVVGSCAGPQRGGSTRSQTEPSESPC